MKKTLNVGAGGRTYKTYPTEDYVCVNIDERELPNIDAVCDVTNLEGFENDSFDHILASDIIEHFPIAKTNSILLEWKRVLKPEGLIEFRLPDLEALCRKYVEGKQDAKLTSWLLYGGQDYPGNYHYVAFDRKWLSNILINLGFVIVSVKDSDNNFELIARKVGE